MRHHIQDSQVDLCGELGHENDGEPAPLRPEDRFGFCCQGCGDCCRSRQDIVLSGPDLHRLSARLRLPPELVSNAFCRQYIGPVSLLPVFRLQPRKDAGYNCPFLTGSRCSVHEARPLVCALYPLGQSIDEDGTVTYYSQDSSCGGQWMEFLLRDYLVSSGIAQRESLDVKWALLNMRLSRWVQAASPTAHPVRLKAAQQKIRRALYLDYDFGEDYAPRLDANLAQLLPRLEKLLGPEPAP